jgi:hypothetical protein
MRGWVAVVLSGSIALAISLATACTSILGIDEIRPTEGTFGTNDAGGFDAADGATE